MKPDDIAHIPAPVQHRPLTQVSFCLIRGRGNHEFHQYKYAGEFSEIATHHQFHARWQQVASRNAGCMAGSASRPKATGNHQLHPLSTARYRTEAVRQNAALAHQNNIAAPIPATQHNSASPIRPKSSIPSSIIGIPFAPLSFLPDEAREPGRGLPPSTLRPRPGLIHGVA